jgi:hypothetical protein
MRLNEFADPKEYGPPVTDAEDFMQQLLLIWPDRSADVPWQQKTATEPAEVTLRCAMDREPRRRRSTS